MATSLAFHNISFSYPQSVFPLLTNITFHITTGWCGLVGNNGAGKTTLINLARGTIQPQSGTVKAPQASFCPQETKVLPHLMEEFLRALYDQDNEAGRLFSLLEIDHDWPYRWETLSHGERKRFQLAAALWEDRDLLMVDEPTNHLDDSSRLLILNSLKQYRGTGLIVCHDRDFMDSLCPQNLFLRGGGITMRPGTLSQGLEQEERERGELRHRRALATQEMKRLEQEAVSRRQLAENQQKRRSKRGLALKDHDSRAKKNLARITGKDGTGGKLLRAMDGRLSQAREHLENLDREDVKKTGVTQHSQVYKGDRILYLREGFFLMGEEKKLIHPELTLGRGDRVALTGNNGTGKSTLIKGLLKGKENDPKILYIPQEPHDRLMKTYQERLAALSPVVKGALISYFSRLGGDPQSLLESDFLSPGEGRKLMLSFGLMDEPALIILDEPTNHLDLGSIQSLEVTLAGVNCSLLLVSHDRRLREKLTNKIWDLEEQSRDQVLLKIRF